MKQIYENSSLLSMESSIGRIRLLIKNKQIHALAKSMRKLDFIGLQTLAEGWCLLDLFHQLIY